MNLESNAANIQLRCSKSIKTVTSNGVHKIVANDLVVIDDDYSLDSDYDTGSDRATPPSPTVIVPETEEQMVENGSKQQQQQEQEQVSDVSSSSSSKADEIVIIESDSDCDDVNPPHVDVPKTETQTVGNGLSEKKLYVHANIHYERNIIAPWPLCLRKCVSQAADSKQQQQQRQQQQHVSDVSSSSSSSKADEIVIIESDSDCDDVNPPHAAGRNGKLNSTMYSSSSSSDTIILDSSDDETETSTVKYHTVEDPRGVIRRIPDYYMANAYPPLSHERLPYGLRIIARRKQKYFPMGYSERGPEFLIHNDDSAFYAGILSCECIERNKRYSYLVFFDDGVAQYVSNSNIRVVFGNYGNRYVHENAQKFYDYYLYRVKARRMMEIMCVPDKNFMVFLNDRLELAKVFEYNKDKRRGLVLLHFLKSNQAEWLYTGSPRIEKIWKLIHKDKQMQQYHQANETLIEVSSDSEDEQCDSESPPHKKPLPIHAADPKQKTIIRSPYRLIDDYKETKKLDRKHKCGKSCVRDFEINPQIYGHDPLKRPILAGWTRKITGICFYVAPCGRSFNTLEAIYKYLHTTRSKLTIDCFSFSSNIDCMKEVITYNGSDRQHFLNDLIEGGNREKRRIPVVPIADNLPSFKEYVIKYRRNPKSKKVPSYLSDTTNNPFRSGCDCTDDCSNKSKCSCWQLTMDGSKKRGGYNFKRLEGRVATGIYECNPTCKCSSKCLNRVVTAQIEQKLELYETKDRGYGLRCQTDLTKGTFVACYFGDILHGKTADERAMKKSDSFFGDEYFMQLDHIEVAEQYKEGYESDVSDIESSDAENGAPSKRFKLDETLAAASSSVSANDNANNMIGYFPNISKKKEQIEVNQRTNLYGEHAVEFVVDGRYRGNIARFFNHSCQPNLFSQTVFIDTHDLRFPWISFFTSEDIKAGTELTWDYGYQIGSIAGREMLCRCGAKNCRKRLL